MRGILIGYSSMNIRFGTIAVYVLNQLMPWRIVALVCLSVPMACAIALCFVSSFPRIHRHSLKFQCLFEDSRDTTVAFIEKPCQRGREIAWLAARVGSKRVLTRCWRVWQLETTQRTRQILQFVHQKGGAVFTFASNFGRKIIGTKTKTCFKTVCNRDATVFAHSIYRFNYFVFAFFFNQSDWNEKFSPGILGTRPYIVQIFKAYESPIAPDRAATITSIIDSLGNLAFIFLVRLTGKRRLYLATLSGIFLTSLAISCYGFIYLPSGYISFNQGQNQSFHLQNPQLAYIPLICLILWSFFSNCGFLAMPWTLFPELLSQKWVWNAILWNLCEISTKFQKLEFWNILRFSHIFVPFWFFFYRHNDSIFFHNQTNLVLW